MTSTTSEPQIGKLIHVACIFIQGRWRHLFLRKATEEHFTWYQELQPETEEETPVSGHTIEEALRLAARHWKEQSFRMLHCGFRYTLPERDEHGINALFHQMIASYSSSNGIYYDEELGNNCFVQNASDEAYQLWKRLSKKP
jgi:hypothetical protein